MIKLLDMLKITKKNNVYFLITYIKKINVVMNYLIHAINNRYIICGHNIFYTFILNKGHQGSDFL